MKRLLPLILAVVLLSSCAHEFNQVFKVNNSNYQYEYAKELYARGKYQQAATLLDGLITVMKGTEYGLAIQNLDARQHNP